MYRVRVSVWVCIAFRVSKFISQTSFGLNDCWSDDRERYLKYLPKCVYDIIIFCGDFITTETGVHDSLWIYYIVLY